MKNKYFTITYFISSYFGYCNVITTNISKKYVSYLMDSLPFTLLFAVYSLDKL